jgi:multicomponent Na+:H+ antiporter subunit A
MVSSPIDWTFLAIAAPFLAAIVAPFVKRAAGGYTGWLLAVVPALMALHFLQFLPDIAGNFSHANGLSMSGSPI